MSEASTDATSESARLFEERDFLLRSLDDLDSERDAGDLDDTEFEALRSSYTVRAAEVLRRIDSPAALEAPATSEQAAVAPGRRSRRRGVMIGLSLAVFGVLAGLALARSVGQRGTGVSLTGSGGSDRERAADCRSLAFAEPESAITCYDALIVDRPDDPEALTYRGWAKVRTGDGAGAELDFERVLAVAPDYPDVYAFRAVVEKNDGRFADAQASLDRLATLDPPADVTDTISSMGLDVAVAEGLLSPDVRECWLREKAAIEGVNAALAAPAGGAAGSLTELVGADQCLTAVLVTRPDEVDALVMRGLAISILYQVSTAAQPDASVLARALEVLDHAVAVAPTDPEARLIRAAVANMGGDPKSAASDLAAIGDSVISPLYRSIDVAAIRHDVERQLAK